MSYNLGAPISTTQPTIRETIPTGTMDEHSVSTPLQADADTVQLATNPPPVDTHPASSDNPVDHPPVVPLTHPEADSDHTHVLPTAPNIHPVKQSQAIKDEHPKVVHREVEKMKADRREIEGTAAGGTVIEGLEDDKLWTMMRRFDQQVTHTLVVTSTYLPACEPDLRRSTLPSLPFQSEILKSNLERCYATVGIVFIRFGGEMLRLRSWSEVERKRTACFCVSYFIAWALGFAIPLILVFLMVLVLIPDSRHFFFPPVLPPDGTPPSATDPLNQKGDESLLGGVDSAVVHRSKSEQVEEQAWEFTQLAQGMLVRVAMGGRHKKREGNASLGEKDMERTAMTDEDSDEEEDLPQGHTGATVTIKEEDEITGKEVEVEKTMSEKQRKRAEAKAAKVKRDEIVTLYTKTAQDTLGDIADFFECLANALSPPPPNPRNYAQFKIAGMILMPAMLAFAVTPSWVWTRGASFAFGAGFFGQPLIDRGLKLFVEKVPDWKDKLDIRNSILSGVPTNDQVVLHLLRVGERASHPLPRPPPPPLAGTPKEQIKNHAPDPDMDLVDDDGEPIEVEDLSAGDKAVHKTKSKLASMFRKTTKGAAGIGADVSVDGVRKTLGSKIDRVIWHSNLKDDNSPTAYPAKLDGKAGNIILTPVSIDNAIPTISFLTASNKEIFTRPINDIVEIKRSNISIPRAVLAFASGADVESQTMLIRMKDAEEKAISAKAKHVDGLEAEDGEHYEFKTVYRREQLFARLIAMGNQRWESL